MEFAQLVGVGRFCMEFAQLVGSWSVLDCGDTMSISPARDPIDVDGALVELWNAAQIENWIRVTLRLANKAAENALQQAFTKAKCFDALDVRSEIIQERWQAAKRHIPSNLHKDLEDMFHQLPRPF